MNTNFYKAIENVIKYNIERRGFDQIKLEGQLKSITNQLLKSKTILIITGFCIKEHMIGETDGPPGAVALANALRKLNKDVVVVTDRYSEKLIIEGRSYFETDFDIEIVEKKNIKSQVQKIIDCYSPEHIIAVERPGKSKDGNFYSMRGEVISNLIPDTDHFFYEAKKRDISTSAIGDGGNELGMGKICDYIKENIECGDIIYAVEKADNLLIATVSNWGCYGVISALSILTNKKLLHSFLKKKEIIEKMVNIGAVDGLTKRNELSVDGFTLEENLHIHKKLESIVNGS